jgi:hypothetical protein
MGTGTARETGTETQSDSVTLSDRGPGVPGRRGALSSKPTEGSSNIDLTPARAAGPPGAFK